MRNRIKRLSLWLLVSALLSLGVAQLSDLLQPKTAVAATDVAIQSFAFSPNNITVTVGTTVTWTNNDSTPHTATSDSSVWASPVLSQGQSFSFTFNTPGTFAYHCALHSSMHGTVTVVAAPQPTATATPAPPAGAAAPELVAPSDGSTLGSFGTTIAWNNPTDATQVALLVIPANNDGPGVDVYLGSAATTFDIPSPPNWYGLLPGMSYTYQVRVSNAGTFVDASDPSWSAWSMATFRTPTVSSDTIGVVSPTNNATGIGQTPTLQWSNSRADVFYYEVQVSKDQNFGPNAFLYQELRHGGVTTPPNSYTVPSAFPLENNTAYFWRVRPRVQGDGTPVAWSTTAKFTTAATQSSAVTPTATAPVPTNTPAPTSTPTRTPTPTATPSMSGGGDSGGDYSGGGY